MDVIQQIISKAKENKKTIVLPEGEDIRIIQAASLIATQGVAEIIILGDEQKITDLAKKEEINLCAVKIIQPDKSPNIDKYAQEFYNLRKDKGMTLEKALVTVKTPMYFGTMMLKLGDVDGLVGGAVCSTADTLRPGMQIVKTAQGVKTISSCFIMSVPNKEYGSNGAFVFADCAINCDPTAQQLADIAIASAATAKSIMGIEPKVAMLSFSTKGSAKNEKVDKVVEATAIAKSIAPELVIDGELQADAAIVQKVADLKSPNSDVAGKANVLIFPDLQSGNIAYKLVQRLANAIAIGPICQGFAKPINDLSRGCNVEDIISVVAMTALQCEV